MKIVYVVDSISDLNKKINLIKNNFGDNIFYVVRADLLDLFKTYGLTANATYYNNLAKVIHFSLLNCEIEDLLFCYASLEFDNALLLRFRNAIGSKNKIVGIMPKYSMIEQMLNSAYNVYVKSLFHSKDSLISNKLQFIPARFVPELLSTHISNRLFEIAPEHCKIIHLDDKIKNKTKTKTNTLRYNLIATIFILLTTILLLCTIAYFKTKFISILLCVILYLSTIVLTAIFHCKSRFDKRFLK